MLGRTENRAEGRVNYDPRMDFFQALDEFCGEKHYWWRRKSASFAVIPGTQTYDLSSNGTGQANAGDLVEIEEMFAVNGSPQQFPCGVHPEFSARDQVAAIYGGSNVNGCFPRTGYFLTLGAFQSLTLGQSPQQAVTAAFTYYAAPMVTDTSIDAIPLVPPNLHWGLVYMFERRIYEMLYDQEDPRFAMANKRYEDFKVIAAKSKSFSSQEAISMSTNHPAVTASGGRGVYRGGRR